MDIEGESIPSPLSTHERSYLQMRPPVGLALPCLALPCLALPWLAYPVPVDTRDVSPHRTESSVAVSSVAEDAATRATWVRNHPFWLT